ncbi:hypothetical protein jhhlp_001681 [Lomentospora prolificans]|uniref:AB hydrolase-1 domain-containing protein n=1 Tax=Lomentospora prolificans TaxID=41688 RepID=A0A2N3NGY0_9PEZI|nr:hypothetical protein jhhlp_001681 [Lomentospora prolificans]
MSPAKVATIEADGVKVFYRYAGAEDAPTLLLLHGQHLPTCFGFTTVPPSRDYQYTFASLTKTLTAFVDALKLKRFAIYIFDYGAPTGLRLALDRPDAVAAIITQNGNAYVDGFGADFWAPIKKAWESGSPEDIEALRGATKFEITKWQYTNGSPHPEAIQPEAYYLDQALMEREGNADIQLKLFYDYRTNVPLYPKFQEYFRTSGVPVLAIWGNRDDIFVAPGAEAFRRDVKRLELHWLDAGHFAIETNEKEAAKHIEDFLANQKVF